MNNQFNHHNRQISGLHRNNVHILSSRLNSGIFYYLLTATRLLFYLTLLNSFPGKCLYINVLWLLSINFKLNGEWAHFTTLLNNFSALGLPDIQVMVRYNTVLSFVLVFIQHGITYSLSILMRFCNAIEALLQPVFFAFGCIVAAYLYQPASYSKLPWSSFHCRQLKALKIFFTEIKLLTSKKITKWKELLEKCA